MDKGKTDERTKLDADTAGSTPPAVGGEHRPIKAADPDVTLHGIPGFHHVEERGDQVRLAHMELDKDAKDRAATGTGDQPGNTHGSRFATPSGEEEK
jgi:hypothetical protein